MNLLRFKQDTSISTAGTHQQDVENGAPPVVPLVPIPETTSSTPNRAAQPFYRKAVVFCILISLLGSAVGAAFIGLGISSANSEQAEQFDRLSSELVNGISSSWKSYEIAGLFVHNTCREGCTRRRFREVYEHIISKGLVFQATSYDPNVTHADRAALENEAKEYYDTFYPDVVNYTGFKGLEPNGGNLTERSEQDFYFPIHYMEPVQDNVGAIGVDLYSSPVRRETIKMALDTFKPALSERLRLLQETVDDAYSVLLMHPGIPLTTQPDLVPSEIASMVIRIPDLLRDATNAQARPSTVYIYDTTAEDADPVFMGASTVEIDEDGVSQVVAEPEVPIETLHAWNIRQKTTDIQVASNSWRIVVVAVEGTYEADILFVALGGIIIFVCTACLALWVFTSIRRGTALQEIQAAAEAEKAAIVVEEANKTSRAAKELNDFISHEVRNPLSAAMSACSFVVTALHDESKPLTEAGAKQAALDDIHIIESSLSFINDLLRNMLDMQRLKSNQLNIDMAPTDILRDILKPVESMLYARGASWKLETEVIPDNLFVDADRLRLKQIMINLGRNASKFVEKGFVRLRADVAIEGNVSLYIEDSGPGIPEEKRKQLFARFQDSLDSLNQGTGIGLSLCKSLADLMGAEIDLDEDYHSGIEGCPGSRFVIKLNKKPRDLNDAELDKFDSHRKLTHLGSAKSMKSSDGENGNGEAGERQELPDILSVLFVDDDLVLRKLFCRAVRKVRPNWLVKEASNGETAIRMVDEDEFDLIFLDQYMASVEKQLLGTETVRALRAKGVKARICGLSANDNEANFLRAGANAFMMKPFPCERESLTRELVRVYCGAQGEAAASDGEAPN